MKKKLALTLLMLLSLTLMLLVGCSKDTYSIDFVTDGATHASVTVTEGELIQLPTTPTKDGYVFDGWYWDKDAWQMPLNAMAISSDGLGERTTVYAKWTFDKTKCDIISFDGAKISDKAITMSIPFTQEVVRVLDLVKASNGATVKLYEDIAGKNELATGIAQPNEGENTYYLLVTSNDGANKSLYTLNITRELSPKITVTVSILGEKVSYEINRGEEISEPKSPDGVIIKKWLVNNEEISFPYTPVKNVTVVGVMATPFDITTVTFQTKENETFNGETTTFEILKGKALSSVMASLPTASWERAEFAGWTTQDGTEITLDSIISEQIILYPNWKNVKIRITYLPSDGYFANESDGTRLVEYGSRLSADDHPIPIREGGYEFEGWYSKPDFSEALDNSHKYIKDIIYYARWTKLFECTDGSFNHDWGDNWYQLTAPTCDKNIIMRRDCSQCFAPQDKEIPGTALGHDWGEWAELGVMQRVHSCKRGYCLITEAQKYKDITFEEGVLPDNPADALSTDGSTMAIAGAGKIGAFLDGNWENTNATTFCGNSPSGKVIITVTLKTPTAMDRIYVKGYGAGSVFIIKVQYEGEAEPVRVGVGNFITFAESEKDINEIAIPFAEVDNTKKITKVIVEMNSPSYGQDYWQEIGFAVIPEEYDVEQSSKSEVVFYVENGESLSTDISTYNLTNGTALSSIMDKLPTASRKGASFKGWKTNSGTVISLDTVIWETTVLYPIWETEKITITYEPGEGYFENASDYENVVDYGSRLSAKDHPTPVRDGGYEFAGWYAKEDFSVGIQYSLKYTQDTTYYARWIKLFECSDGSYDHDWGNGWYELTAATCDKGAMMRRECSICMSPQDEQNPTGLGHKWSQWSELGVMQRLRSCERTGCSATETQKFKNITFEAGVLPDDPAEAVSSEGSTMTIVGAGRIGAVLDGNWENGHATTFVGNGLDGSIIITITLKNPTAMDRIYVKGYGVGSAFIIKAQYEGEAGPVRVGNGNFITFAENEKYINEIAIPFAEVDNTKKITKVIVEMNSPSYGQDFWQEIGFAVIPDKYKNQ